VKAEKEAAKNAVLQMDFFASPERGNK